MTRHKQRDDIKRLGDLAFERARLHSQQYAQEQRQQRVIAGLQAQLEAKDALIRELQQCTQSQHAEPHRDTCSTVQTYYQRGRQYTLVRRERIVAWDLLCVGFGKMATWPGRLEQSEAERLASAAVDERSGDGG